MGISVTAGAITTVIAGAFLSLCILTFFVKFSFLICWWGCIRGIHLIHSL
jgi:hypothetical protein